MKPRKLVDIFCRSDFEMFTQGNADTLTKLFTPIFGKSSDKRIKISWLFWNFYIGYAHDKTA